MSEKDSANPPQFPQEMVENFTSFLWDDPKSISHCSLVSHRWYSAVRPFIYRRIVLESKERLTRFEHLLLGDPAIGYWVRELHIVGGHRYYKTYSFWPEIFVSPGSGTFFPGRVLPEKLKKLYALTFECVYTSSVGASAHSIRAVSSAFASTVRSLTFMSCLGHEGFFLAFAHAFPNLNELRLMKVATKPLLHGTPLADDPDRSLAQFQEEVIPFMPLCLTQGNPTAEYDHPQTFITSLRIDHPDFVQDCESLFCTKSLRTVQALEIRHSGSRLHPIDDISNKILPECGRALRSLKLTIASLPEPEEIVRYEVQWMPGFTHLKNLRHLELQMRTPHRFVLSLLDTCLKWCSKLATLILHISFPHIWHISASEGRYHLLDAKVAAATGRALKEVQIVYFGPEREVQLRKWMEEAFPCLRAAENDRGLRLRLKMAAK